MITDPALACHVLNSPVFDKFPFLYNYLGPVSIQRAPEESATRLQESLSKLFSKIEKGSF